MTNIAFTRSDVFSRLVTSSTRCEKNPAANAGTLVMLLPGCSLHMEDLQ